MPTQSGAEPYWDGNRWIRWDGFQWVSWDGFQWVPNIVARPAVPQTRVEVQVGSVQKAGNTPKQLAVYSTILGVVSLFCLGFGWLVGGLAVGIGIYSYAGCKREGLGVKNAVLGIIFGAVGILISGILLGAFLLFGK